MQDSRITVLPNAASGNARILSPLNCLSMFLSLGLSILLLLCPDDKACTFVGTAAYVPPEVLNSSPATLG